MFVCCKACGKGCDAMGECMHGACKGCCKACDSVGDFLCPVDKPSPIFTLFSAAVNIALIVVTGMGIAKTLSGDKDTDQTLMWLAATLVVGVLNILFAVYIYRKFAKATSWNQKEGEERQSAWKAACNLCAYDVGVFLYFFVLVFQLVWSFMDGKFVTCDSTKDWCAEAEDDVSLARLLIWVYVFLGGCVMMFSVCTSACNSKTSRRGYTEVQPAYKTGEQQPVQYNGTQQ
eukprot:TRINITY_DN1943_c0_g2_i1.p1 TRINITY_DN1943_c0_g2~~TRINITY_DN1943_c0_g2_i1.p1  ORF type:complete len:231 (+),score=93.01 TRINITY_DN1943_c0_g2_i1:74-766(+)